jgi:plasmid maintenance system antidote protein VapI
LNFLSLRRINEIGLGKRALTADTSLCLAKPLKTSEVFSLGLEADYDPEETRRQASAPKGHRQIGSHRAMALESKDPALR